MKKSNIYTKTGDKGTTALVGGKRVPKTDIRIESYGTIDELNSFIGLLTAEITTENTTETKSFLRLVQHKLFSIGSHLATDQDSTQLRTESIISPESITAIENEIDRLDEALPKLNAFVLPGGNRAASLAHVCRTICRRAERNMHAVPKIDPNTLAYINRLSDYLFVLARTLSLTGEGKEIIWDYTCK